MKSRQNSVEEFIFSTGVGFHLASLPKNITSPSQVFYKDIAEILRARILGQLLNGCLHQNNVENLDKKPIQCNMYIYNQLKLKQMSKL